MTILKGCRILVCEDEPMIAQLLELGVEEAGGTVLGPLARNSEALALLRESGGVDGAILDYNLRDGPSVPVMRALREAGVPTIIHTGGGVPNDVQQRFPTIRVFLKPMRIDELMQAVANQMRETG